MTKQKSERFEVKSSYALTRTLLLSLGLIWAAPAAAIDWDDAGNSASKLWDDNGNWNPDGDPDGLAVNIGNLANAAGDATLIDRVYTITSLTITNGASVTNSTDGGASNDFELIVNGLTTIGGAGSTFFVIGADLDGLDTQGLTINSGGTLNLNSTTSQGEAVVEIESGVLDLNAGGTIIGQGRIDFEDPAAAVTSVFINDGTLTANRAPVFFGQAPVADTLQLNDGGNANRRFDWDGLSGAGIINVNGNQTLDVDISTGTDGFGGTMNLGTGSTLDMRDAWSMDAGTINANTPAFGFIIIGQDPNPGPGATITGAAWTMSGGTVNVDDNWDTLILDSNVTATGGVWNINGTLRVDGTAVFAGGTSLTPLGGTADLVVNGNMTMNQATFNWDGFVTTTVNDGAVLTINSTNIDDALDGYDGTLNINGGTVNINNLGWSLEIATINMDTSATSSDLGGNAITVNSASATINVTGTGAASANINAALIIDAAMTANIAAGTTLNLATNTINVTGTTWAGGAGSILRNGVATINALTTYSMSGGSVDLDDGNDVLNAQLNINAANLDDSGDGVDGTLTINNTGSLNVNLDGNAAWQMDGVLTYNGDATSGTIVSGNSPVEFQPASTLNVNGEGAMIARAIFEGTVNINTVGEDLELFGGNTTPGSTNVINGATVNGPGVLAISGGQALRGNGIINAPIRGSAASQLIAENGLLDVNAAFVDLGVIGTAGAAAVLDIAAAWNTNITDTVLLQDGRIQGATITNDGASGINGFGSVIAAINNNTRIDAEGGTLIIENTTNNWDGTTNAGSLNALTGNLELRDNAAFLFLGTVQADAGRQVFANGFELEFDPGSNLNLNGGTFRSTNATDIGGNVTTGAGPNSTLQIAGTTVFESTSTTTLNGNLILDNPTTRVQSGATFAGGSSLINAVGRTLVLLDGADVDVLVENRGTLVLGASPGQTSGLDFQQTAAGTWDVELGGTGLNDFDRMTLSGLASLDGTLDISLFGGFAPSLGDNFTILIAGSVIGTFDAVLGTPGAGLMYDVIYNANNVTLSVVTSTLVGDLDGDGFVGITDLNIVLGNWNQTVPPGDPLADPSGDNFVGIADLNIVLGNWNAGTPPTSGSQAVPEPAALLLWLAAGAVGMRRRA